MHLDHATPVPELSSFINIYSAAQILAGNEQQIIISSCVWENQSFVLENLKVFGKSNWWWFQGLVAEDHFLLLYVHYVHVQNSNTIHDIHEIIKLDSKLFNNTHFAAKTITDGSCLQTSWRSTVVACMTPWLCGLTHEQELDCNYFFLK